MSTAPLLGPAPVPVAGGETLYPGTNVCFTCTPPYKHERDWVPKPDAPGRERTLVLCFDGTGDSFDQDVSRSSGIMPDAYRVQL